MRPYWRVNQAGISLIEVMVGAAVLAVLTTAAYSVFHAGARYHLRVATSMELQQSVMTVRAVVASELSETHPSALRTFNTPPGVVFASPRDSSGEMQFTTSGAMLWQKLVTFYLDQGKVVRKEVALLTPQTDPPTITLAQSTSYYQSQSGLPTRQLGEDVVDFQVNPGSTLELVVASERTLSSKLFRSETRTRVFPRNQ